MTILNKASKPIFVTIKTSKLDDAVTTVYSTRRAYMQMISSTRRSEIHQIAADLKNDVESHRIAINTDIRDHMNNLDMSNDDDVIRIRKHIKNDTASFKREIVNKIKAANRKIDLVLSDLRNDIELRDAALLIDQHRDAMKVIFELPYFDADQDKIHNDQIISIESNIGSNDINWSFFDKAIEYIKHSFVKVSDYKSADDQTISGYEIIRDRQLFIADNNHDYFMPGQIDMVKNTVRSIDVLEGEIKKELDAHMVSLNEYKGNINRVFKKACDNLLSLDASNADYDASKAVQPVSADSETQASKDAISQTVRNVIARNNMTPSEREIHNEKCKAIIDASKAADKQSNMLASAPDGDKPYDCTDEMTTDDYLAMQPVSELLIPGNEHSYKPGIVYADHIDGDIENDACYADELQPLHGSSYDVAIFHIKNDIAIKANAEIKKFRITSIRQLENRIIDIRVSALYANDGNNPSYKTYNANYVDNLIAVDNDIKAASNTAVHNYNLQMDVIRRKFDILPNFCFDDLDTMQIIKNTSPGNELSFNIKIDDLDQEIANLGKGIDDPAFISKIADIRIDAQTSIANIKLKYEERIKQLKADRLCNYDTLNAIIIDKHKYLRSIANHYLQSAYKQIKIMTTAQPFSDDNYQVQAADGDQASAQPVSADGDKASKSYDQAFNDHADQTIIDNLKENGSFYLFLMLWSAVASLAILTAYGSVMM